MEDELMSLLKISDPTELEKIGYRSKQVSQELANVGARPDYTQDVSEMQRNGFVWDGYRWVKPESK